MSITHHFESALELVKRAEIRLHEEEVKLDTFLKQKTRPLQHRTDFKSAAEIVQHMGNIDRRYFSVCELIEKHMPHEVTRRQSDQLNYIASRMGL